MATSGIFQRGPSPLRSAVSTGLSTKRISLTRSRLPVKQLARLTYSQPRGAVTPGTPLTPPDTQIKEAIAGNPNLRPETAYEWVYGAVVTPGKWWSPLQGLTLQADFYHIDLRNVIIDRDANAILANNWVGHTGTLPNGAPTGGPFSELIQRDPITGAVLNVNAVLQNVS